MTLSASTNSNQYTGNGALATYSYTFKIFAESDIVIVIADADGVETEALTIATDYTVTGVGEASGGTIVLVDAGQDWIDAGGDLKSDYVINIRRVRPLTQLTDIRNQGDFFPETYEDALDSIIMIVQQLQEQLDRAVLAGPTESTVSVAALSASIAAAVAAQVAAVAAQAGAEAAQTAAETAETNAETAETNAETAETNAEAAQAAAEAAVPDFKVGSFTRDMSLATSTQEITGVGFLPKVVMFFAAVDAAEKAAWGASDGSSDEGIRSNWSGTDGNFGKEAYCLSFEDSGGSQRATISSFGADGFTLSWVKTSTPGAATLKGVYIAIG